MMLTLLKTLITWIRSHQVMCAWCKKEGMRKPLCWSRARHSHGICERHRKQLLKEAGS